MKQTLVDLSGHSLGGVDGQFVNPTIFFLQAASEDRV